MDDLDHSMHIAENDWTRFYEESEECSLLQPSLACTDNSSLSDSEISANVVDTTQQESQQSPTTDRNITGCSIQEENCTACVKQSLVIQQSGTGGQQDGVTMRAQEGCGSCEDSKICPGGGNMPTTREVHMKTAVILPEVREDSTNKLQSLSTKMNEDVQDESKLKLTQEADPYVNDPNVSEPHTAESEDVSRLPLRAEKERWFVTVNYSPAKHRVKKKLRQRKTCKENPMCRPRQENTLENACESEMNKDRSEEEGEKDMESNTPSNETSGQDEGMNPETLGHMPSLDSGDVSCDLFYSPKENTPEPTVEKHTEPCSLLHEAHKDHPQLESVESDEDCVEFFSIHDSDSEGYLSAAEPEDPPYCLQDPPTENQQAVISSDSHMNENTDEDLPRDGETHSCEATLASDCEGCESTCRQAYVEPTMTFPCAGQRTDITPDNNCCNDTGRTVPNMILESPGLKEDKSPIDIDRPASGCSPGDKLAPLPLCVPDLTVTPCSAADSPETYAAAAGLPRLVYSISAFWDDMEKLTINDILQLRMARSPSPRETTDVTTHSLADTDEYNLSEGGLMDTSDTADSDYFTQPDESKPDRSSWDFSTSDFEEEQWQFMGSSRNPSPDHCSKTQYSQSRTDSPSSAHKGVTSSDGKLTPGDFAGQCLEPQGSQTSAQPTWSGRMIKSRSVHNVRALSTGDLSLSSFLGNDESRVFACCTSVEESLGSLLPAPILSNTDALDGKDQTSFQEEFEGFTQDKTKNDCRCLTVYDPKYISVLPEYTICSLDNELSFPSQYREECKAIPIFSCSHPTVRELTFPKQDYFFLSADSSEGISPIRVVSHSLIQASDCGMSTAAHCWKGLQLLSKIRFQDKGSIWCRRSGATVFPFEAERRTNPQIPVLRVSSSSSQSFGELAVQWRTLETTQATSKCEPLFRDGWNSNKHIQNNPTVHLCAYECLLQIESASSPCRSSQICVWFALPLHPGY